MSNLIHIADEAAMIDFGERLASVCAHARLVFLQGELGAGKSTMVRGFMKGCGYHGRVKSPTFTLVEPYELGDKTVYHMDLYRLSDPEELEFIGIRDMLGKNSVCLVEWPDKAGGMLGKPDITIKINYLESGRDVELIGLNSDSVELIK